MSELTQITVEPSQWEVDFNEVLRERNEALAKIAELDDKVFELREVLERALRYVREIGHSEDCDALLEQLEKALA